MVRVADRSTHKNMRITDHPAPSRLVPGLFTQARKLRLRKTIGILAIDVNCLATFPVKLLAHMRLAAAAPKRFIFENAHRINVREFLRDKEPLALANSSFGDPAIAEPSPQILFLLYHAFRL